jgi:hypothetical protein
LLLDRDRTVTASSSKFVTQNLAAQVSGLGGDRVINVLAGKTRMIVAILAFPLLFLTACSDATRPIPPPVTLSFCGSSPQVRPDDVAVVCGANAITAVNLAWSGWGKPTATAKGSAIVDLCAYEDCATGNYVSVPIEVTASKIMHCAKNVPAYSTLRYRFPDGSPFQGVPASVIANESSTEGDSVPPANQTVSLTC